MILSIEAGRYVLFETLCAYYDSDFSPQCAAEKLHVHKNTVMYRLSRIEELLQCNLREYRQIVSIGLALEAQKLLFSHDSVMRP